jgi:hypothetical protein
MQSRTALFGTLAFTSVAIAVSPRAALSPGSLTQGHAEIEGGCLTCHTPLRGTPAGKCIKCHPLDSIGMQRRSLVLPANARPALSEMHKSFAKVDCGECHTDHVGSDPARSTRGFSHDVLNLELRRRCVGCHDGGRPADELHRQVGDDCAACHSTTEWKPATFDHQQFGVRRACTTCHEQKRPTDALHRQAGEDCGACHTTSAWTPASFEHDEYFVLDQDHQTGCTICHTQPGSYKDYTCYGCHEHTPAGMTAKHSEERVTNLGDCVRCHRSAAKHQGEEGGRRKQRREEEHEGRRGD